MSPEESLAARAVSNVVTHPWEQRNSPTPTAGQRGVGISGAMPRSSGHSMPLTPPTFKCSAASGLKGQSLACGVDVGSFLKAAHSAVVYIFVRGCEDSLLSGAA